MKKELRLVLASFGLICLPLSSAFAAADLQQLMQAMSGHFKTIVTTNKDTTKYPALADDAVGIQDNAVQALTVLPDKVNAMTDAALKRAAKIEYRTLMTNLLEQAIILESAFLKTNPSVADVKTVTDTIDAIKLIMKDGHTKFK